MSLTAANLYLNLFLMSPLQSWLIKMWWKLVPGVNITLPWPRGPVEVGPNHRLWDGVMSGELRQVVESADPNDHYRPWLEKHVGRQYWDWDWQWAQASYYPGRYGARVLHDSVLIKVRRRYRAQAAEMKLMLG